MPIFCIGTLTFGVDGEAEGLFPESIVEGNGAGDNVDANGGQKGDQTRDEDVRRARRRLEWMERVEEMID